MRRRQFLPLAAGLAAAPLTLRAAFAWPDQAIKLVVRRRFSGELLSADNAPKSFLREEGIWSVNRRNELVWTLALPPVV